MKTQAIIEGIEKITQRRIVARAPEAAVNAFCQGLEITIEFDPQQYHSSNLLLFANVLEHFFNLYCSINSFVKLVATLKGQEGIWRTWPARIGEKQLV
jgi:type VI secretion system protein ImpG